MSYLMTGVALSVGLTRSSLRKLSESLTFNATPFLIFARLHGLAPRAAGGLLFKLVHYVSQEGLTLDTVIGRSHSPSLKVASWYGHDFLRSGE